MTIPRRNLIIGDDVTNEIYSQYDNPIVCSKSSPNMDGFIPTSFSDLSSVVSSIGMVLDNAESISNLVMLPISSFRSDWKYYGVQYSLDLINDFSELLAAPCYFVSKLQEYLTIENVLVAVPKHQKNIFDVVREEFILEYMDRNHPKLNVRRLKLA